MFPIPSMQVIESDAEKITTGVPRSKVVVKMLKDDASTDEQQLFFEEVAPFRSVLLYLAILCIFVCTLCNKISKTLSHNCSSSLI